MAVRTQQEINDLGFQALVGALGKEDAIRFIRAVGVAREMPAADDSADEYLPPMTAEEVHQKILDMRDPAAQAGML